MKNNKIKLLLSLIMSLSTAATMYSAGISAGALTDQDEMLFTKAFSTSSNTNTKFFIDQSTKKIYIQGGATRQMGGEGLSMLVFFSSIEENGKSKLRDTYRWNCYDNNNSRGDFYINDVQQTSDQHIADTYKKWLEGKKEIIIESNQSEANSYNTLFYKTEDFIKEYNKNQSQTRTIPVYMDKPNISLHSGVELNEKDEKGLVVDWSSDDLSVAAVDKYGELTPVSTGECLITAKIAGTDVVLSETKVRVYKNAEEKAEKESLEESVEESEEDNASILQRNLDGEAPSPEDVFNYVNGLL